MMYKSLDDLPNTVKKILPTGAQKIYFAAYNSGLKQAKGDSKDDDGQAHAIAWSAVKKKYHKNKDGEWVEGASEEKVSKESAQAFVTGLVTGSFETDGAYTLAEAYQSTVDADQRVVLSEDEAAILEAELDVLQEKIDTVRKNTAIQTSEGGRKAFCKK